MKMKKYMAMGLGAIMAVGIAVSGVLPVSADNNTIMHSRQQQLQWQLEVTMIMRVL